MELAELTRLAEEVFPLAVEVRRHLHANPELSFEEYETAKYLTEKLKELGLESVAKIAGTGVKAVISGERPGACLALRADIDALPIQEETGLPFASRRPGVMHACGHDVHTAILLATAAALVKIRPTLAGKVVLLFQPAEETPPGGARLMIEEGGLDDPPVQAIFGLHIDPYSPVGSIGLGAGPRYASTDNFAVRVLGRGGHASRPHEAVDPVVTAAQIIVALQTIVSRNVDPFDQLVVTVSAIEGGQAFNIIPDEVSFRGTVRCNNLQVWEHVPRRIEEIISGVCAAAGAQYEWEYQRGYPVLINDEAMTELAQDAAGWVFGAENVLEMTPVMGAEDFAYYLQRVPGSFAKLGCAPAAGERHGLHTSKLTVDEACMLVGIKYYLALVDKFFSRC